MTIENLVPTDRRGFIIRTLRVGEEVDVSGYGIEILDNGGGQNEAGRAGRLYFGQGHDSIDPARPAEPFIPCIPGVRRVALFDRILYVHDTSGIGGSTPVRVKILTIPRAAWVETDPAGVPRSKHLARTGLNGINLAANGSAGDVATIYENLGQIEDRFQEDERFDARGYWHGVVCGSRAFHLYVETKPSALDPTRFYVQKFIARDYSGAAVSPRMLAAEPAVAAQFVVTFDTGNSADTMTNTSIRVQVPQGIFAMHILNTDAGGINQVHYDVGVVAHQ